MHAQSRFSSRLVFMRENTYDYAGRICICISESPRHCRTHFDSVPLTLGTRHLNFTMRPRGMLGANRTQFPATPLRWWCVTHFVG